MTTITSSSTAGLTLSTSGDFASTNPVSIISSVTLSNVSGDVVEGGGQAWTIQNSGLLQSAFANGYGVALTDGGLLTNLGTINAGTFAGAVNLSGGVATVVNAGLIETSDTQSGPSSDGIYIGAGAVTNQAAGTISAYGDGVVIGGVSASILNSGTISGSTGVVLARPGETIVNHGLLVGTAINGYGAGQVQSNLIGGAAIVNTAGAIIEDTQAGGVGLSILDGTSTVSNAGTIAGYSNGITLGAGYVTNAASGLIEASGTVNSYGLLTGFNPTTVQNAGVIMASRDVGAGVLNGEIVNQASGTIAGATGASVFDQSTLVNAGTIIGTGGTAVAFMPTIPASIGGVLIVDPGAVFIGQVDGGTYGSTLDLASASSAGTLAGLGATYTRFSHITVEAGAHWVLSGSNNTVAAGYTLTNDGTLGLSVDGVLTNAGLITSPSMPGILLDHPDQSVTNLASGTITGATALGAYSNGDVIDNFGLVQGSGTGIVAKGVFGDTITNEVDATITGANGILLASSGGTILNSGTIAGLGSSYNAGIVATLPSSEIVITNAAQGSITGASGIYLAAANSSITNEGAIIGTAASSGFAGILVGASAVGATIANLGGTISGYSGIALYAPNATITNMYVVTGTGTGTQAGIEVGSAATDAQITNELGVAPNVVGVNGMIHPLGISAGSLGIFGYSGIQVSADGATITNLGTITGTGANLSVQTGGIVQVPGYIGLDVINQSGATISGYFGVYVGGTAATLFNQGVVEGYTANGGTGLYLGTNANGAYVSNATGGYISGYTGLYVGGTNDTLNNAGGSVAGFRAIAIGGDDATVINAGSVAPADTQNGFGIYVNSDVSGLEITNQADGSIIGGTGIYVAGGSNNVLITNDADATIVGRDAIYLDASASTIINGGLLTTFAVGHAFSGIYAGSAATDFVVTNDAGGSITGRDGIYANATGSITNQGTIVGSLVGIQVGLHATSLHIDNLSGGTISAGYNGIYLRGADSDITNQGTILGSGVGDGNYAGIYEGVSATAFDVLNEMTGTITGDDGILVDAGGTITNAGTIMAGGATPEAGIYAATGAAGLEVTNMLGATISGQHGVYLQAAGVVVTNDGRIVGGYADRLAGIATSLSGTDEQVTNAAGATITGDNGLYLLGAGSRVVNHGLIAGPGDLSAGVGIYGGSAATGLSIDNAVDGTISGADGVSIGAEGATINNLGQILTQVIDEPADGIYAGTGATDLQVTNGIGGTIIGSLIAIKEQAADVHILNQGVLAGQNGAGVAAFAGGSGLMLDNQSSGTISGFVGVYLAASGDTVTNQGTILATVATNYAIDSSNGSSGLQITNGASGVITGGGGIDALGVDTTIANQGQILGTETAQNYSGIWLESSATDALVANAAGGTISGGVALFLGGFGQTVTNDGLLSGRINGIEVASYGGTASISNAITGTIIASINGIDVQGPGVSVVNDGLISSSGGLAVYVYNQGSYAVVTNAAGAVIAGMNGVYLGTGHDTVINHGAIQTSGDAVFVQGSSAAIANDGLISAANGFGIDVYGQGSDAVITNGVGGVVSGRDGVYVGRASGDTIINQGTIQTAGSGANAGLYGAVGASSLFVSNDEGGTISGSNFGVQFNPGTKLIGPNLVVQGAVIGDQPLQARYGTIQNAAGAAITGVTAGIYQSSGGLSIANLGAISGNNSGIDITAGIAIIDNGAGGTIAAANNAIVAFTPDSLVAITNAAGGLISAYGGDGIAFGGAGSLLSNAGTIDGHGMFGVYATAPVTITNAAGAYLGGYHGGIILLDGGSITNAGTVDAVNGTAIAFGTASGQLTIDPGASFHGVVDGGSALSSLELASGASTGSLSGLGTSIVDFGSVTVDAGANWVLGGPSNALPDGALLTNDGTLALDATSLIMGGGIVLNDGVVMLDTATLAAAGLNGTGTVDIGGTSALVISLATSSGETVAFTGGGGGLLQLGVGDDFGGTIAGFAVLDTIDIANLGFVAGSSTASVSGNVLTVTDGLSTDQFDTSGLADGAAVLSLNDGEGGTDLVLAGSPAPADLALAPGNDSGIAGDQMTDIADPVIQGTGVAGATVTLYEGLSVLGTAIVAANGTWSLATGPLTLGAHALTAAQTAPFGELSLPSSVYTLIIDAAPTAPFALALAPASDSGLLGDDITDAATPIITGEGTPGDSVTLFEGNSVLGTATVGLDGTWSVTSTALAAGAHVLTATETDAAGDISSSSAALALTIEVLASPALTLAPASDSGVQGDDITNVTTPEITGTGVAGDSVTVYDGTLAVGSALVAEDGTWAITTTPLTAGLHDLTAVQSDIEGGISPASPVLALTIETMAPPAPPDIFDPSTEAAPAEPVVTGSAEANSTITLYDGGLLVGTAAVDATGAWSYDFTSPLAVGDHVLTATDTDAAGNVSTLSLPVSVQIAASGGYSFAGPPTAAGDVTTRTHDSTGLLIEIAITNASGQLLESVTNTQAILEIYDSAGTLIGTITQPSISASSQPIFGTTGQTLSATTGSGPVGSVIDLIAESNFINSQGNDTINAGPGADTIFASGATSLINSGSGSLFYAAATAAVTVTGGSGSSTIWGGTGGGFIVGGSAGNNILAAAGGAATIVGGGDGDTLIGGAGTNTEVMVGDGVAFAGAGASTVFGADGGTLIGADGPATLVAGGGAEALWAGSGNATLFGGAGPDTLGGGTGTSLLVGGAGNTTFIGSTGSSTVFGGAGNDIFFGGSGSAIFVQGAGNDEVQLGAGALTVFGGTGTDLYDVTAGVADGGNELIENFKVGTDQLRFFGFGSQDIQTQVENGSTVMTLTDGTTITLVGVTNLPSESIAFTH